MPMPRGRPVGSGKDRHLYLRVRVSETEMKAIDAKRGGETRSNWVRGVLARAMGRKS
jgi:hypothetical protein